MLVIDLSAVDPLIEEAPDSELSLLLDKEESLINYGFLGLLHLAAKNIQVRIK